MSPLQKKNLQLLSSFIFLMALISLSCNLPAGLQERILGSAGTHTPTASPTNTPQPLPPSIVEAFRATLEEIDEANLLLHVVDITHHDAAEQCQTVENILVDLHLDTKPRLTVLNKVDLAVKSMEDLTTLTFNLKLPGDNIVSVSALKGWGLDDLLHKITVYLDQEQILATKTKPK